MKKLALSLAVMLVVAAACAGAPPLKTNFDATRSYEQRFEAVWEAVVENFAETNTPIKTIDKNSGLIVAEMMAVPHEIGGRAIASDYCDCGEPPGMFVQRGLAGSFNIFVKKRPVGGVIVRVNARFVTRVISNLALPPVECESKGYFERMFFYTLESKLLAGDLQAP